jgi:hypothetical protein
MELFPAANDDQWNWIKRVIEESDYYVVILAGRYGSVSAKTGLSYTEMEYQYALELGKPVIGFVHEDPKQLPAKYYESDSALREKLDAFRDLVRSKLCKQWTAPADLGAKVSRSLTQLIRQYPAVGWVRANMISPEAAKEALGLRHQIEELKAKLDQVAIHGPAGTESLAQGDDSFKLHFSFERQTAKTGKNDNKYWVKAGEETSYVEVTWNELFSKIAPSMIEPATSYVLVNDMTDLVVRRSAATLSEEFPDDRFQNYRLHKSDYDTIMVQLRALGLMATTGQRDTWGLTDYGDAYMNKLLAVHRTNIAGRSTGRAKPRRPT